MQKTISFSQNSRNQGFSYYFFLMIEGSGSGSIPLTNGSGSRRLKNIRIRRIRIRMDPQHCRKQFLFQLREPDDQLAAESFVPGTGRVYVKTWGCAHNSSDSEYMAGQLAAEVSRIFSSRFSYMYALLHMRIRKAVLIK
jgi:hypothetical protein